MVVEPINISAITADLSGLKMDGYFKIKAFTELAPKYLEYLRNTRETLLSMETFLNNYLNKKTTKSSSLELCKLRRIWDDRCATVADRSQWGKYIIPGTKETPTRAPTFKELGFVTTKHLADASDILMSTRNQVATIASLISHKSNDIIKKIKDNFVDKPTKKDDELLWELVFVVIRGTAETCKGICKTMSKRDNYLDYMRAQLGIMWYQVETTLKALKIHT